MKDTKIVLSTIAPHVRYLQLGLYLLKAYAEKNSQNKEKKDIIVDVFYYDNPEDAQQSYVAKNSLIRKSFQILKNNPAIVGFSCFCWNINPILDMCKIIKKINPQVIIILGGPEVSNNDNYVIKNNPCVDIIVRDEGEATFTEIVDYYFLNKQELTNIKGITYRHINKIYRNIDRESLDLKNLQSPYLNNLVDLKQNYRYTIETSRGCPFKCAFCTEHLRMFSRVRFIPIEHVLEEVDYLLRGNIKYLWINDDNFNLSNLRAIQILERIAHWRKKIDLQVFVNAQALSLSDQLVRLFKKNNVVLNMGIQSVNSITLSIIDRKTVGNFLEENLKKLKKENVSFRLEFIVGLPGDRLADVKASINWAAQMGPRCIDLSILRGLKGSRLRTDAKKLGIKFFKKAPYYIMKTNLLKQSEIIETIEVINYIELFYNQGLLRNTIHLFIKKFQINLTDIINEWTKLKIDKILSPNRLRPVQEKFIRPITNKYKLATIPIEIEKSMNLDLKSYIEESTKGDTMMY